MSSFLKEVDEGLKGLNQGLDMGLPKFNRILSGVHPGMIYTLAAEPKAGKTTIFNIMFMLGPYLSGYPKLNIDYFATEMPLVETIANCISYMIYREEGIVLDSEYILGRKRDPDTGKPVKLSRREIEMVTHYYKTWMEPLFGVYDYETGKVKTRGIVNYHQYKPTAEGFKKYMFNVLTRRGTFSHKNIAGDRITDGWTPFDPEVRNLVLFDHIRGVNQESALTMKKTVDSISSTAVDLRNWCKITFAFTVHLNRGITDINKIKFMKETLYPDDTLIKDSGNLAEDFLGIVIKSLKPFMSCRF